MKKLDGKDEGGVVEVKAEPSGFSVPEKLDDGVVPAPVPVPSDDPRLEENLTLSFAGSKRPGWTCCPVAGEIVAKGEGFPKGDPVDAAGPVVDVEKGEADDFAKKLCGDGVDVDGADAAGLEKGFGVDEEAAAVALNGLAFAEGDAVCAWGPKLLCWFAKGDDDTPAACPALAKGFAAVLFAGNIGFPAGLSPEPNPECVPATFGSFVSTSGMNNEPSSICASVSGSLTTADSFRSKRLDSTSLLEKN